jgi:hypothetical protein
VLDTGKPMVKRYWQRSRRAGGADSSYLAGSDFRMVDGRYLVYLSLDGTLMATRVEDPDSLRWAGRCPGHRHSPAGVQWRRRSYQVTAGGPWPTLRGSTATSVSWYGWGGMAWHPQSPGGRSPPVHPQPGRQSNRQRRRGRRAAGTPPLRLVSGASETIDQGLFGTSVVESRWPPPGVPEGPESVPGGLYLRSLDLPGAPVELLAPARPLVMQVSSYLADDFLLVGSNTARGA